MPIWKIILDHLKDPGDMIARNNVEVGENQHLLGASNDGSEKFRDVMFFRLKDDDGIIYFLGIMDLGVFFRGSEEDVFAPLRWAMADSGCTTIEFLEGGSWKRQ